MLLFLRYLKYSRTVQDATWYRQLYPAPYVEQFADYFTKYTFSDEWRRKVHGIFGDGSNIGTAQHLALGWS